MSLDSVQVDTAAYAADVGYRGCCTAPLYTSVIMRPAPPFLLQDLQGEYRRLMDYSGKVVIVNFWATW